MQTGIVGILYQVDYSQVTKGVAASKKLETDVVTVSQKSAAALSKAFVDAEGQIVRASRATRIAVQQDAHVIAFQRIKGEQDYQAAFQRVDETRKRGLKAIRQAIFDLEKEKRELALKSVHTIDAAEQRSHSDRIRRINAELQLHRSSEKQFTGRTFTEQLEKNFQGPIIGQMGMMRQQFASMREAMSAPVASGGGMIGTLSGFATKAVPVVAGALAVGAALKGIIEIGSQAEDALADFSAITGVQGPALRQIETDVRNTSKAYGIDFVQAIGASKLAVSAFGPAVAKDREALNSMNNSILTLAKASGVDATVASQALTNTVNQFGFAAADAKTQAQQMNKVMNIMAAGSKEGAAEVADLSISMKEAGTVAHMAGLSMEQTVGALEIMSQAGIKGSEAGTGLKNVLLSLSAGTDESKGVLKQLGLTFNDINPKTVGFEKSLSTVRGAMENLKNPTDRATVLKKLFGKENAASANILLASSKVVDGHSSSLAKMTTAVTGTNTAQEQAKTKMATMSETWNRITVAVKDFGLTIFKLLQPAIETVLGVFEDVVGVIGPVADFIGGVLSFAFKGLKVTIEVMIFPLKLLWNTFKAIGGFLIDTLTPAFNWFKDKVIAPIGKVMSSVATAIMNAWDSVKKWVSEALEWIAQKWQDAKVMLNDISFGLLGESEEDQATEAMKDRMQARLDAARKAQEEARAKGTVISSSKDPQATPTEDVGPAILDQEKGKAKSALEILKDRYQAEEAIIAQAFERRKAVTERQFAEGVLTEQSYRDQKLADEKAHLNKVVKLESDFTPKFLALDKSEGEVRALEMEKANTRLAQIAKEGRVNSAKDAEDAMAREITALRENQNEAANAAEDALERGVLTRRKYLEISHKNALDSMDAEIATLKEYAEQFKGVDDDKYNATIKAMVKAEGQRRGMATQFAKSELDEKTKYQKDLDDRTLAVMEDGIEKKLKAEELRYRREIEMAELTAEQKLLIEKEHTKNIADITKEGEEKKAKDVNVYTSIVSGFFEKGYKDRSKFLHESIATDILGQEKGFFKQKGSFKKFLADQLKTFLTNKIAEALIHTSTEASKTGATQAGVLARVGATVVEIGQSILAAGAAAFNAVIQGVRWVFTTIPFPFNFIAAASIPPAVYGLYRGAKSLFKFADGAITTGSVFGKMPNGATAEAGEAGREAIIPLQRREGKEFMREAIFDDKSFSLRRLPPAQIIQSTPTVGLAAGVSERVMFDKFDQLVEAFDRKEYISILDQREQRLSAADEYARVKKRRL